MKIRDLQTQEMEELRNRIYSLQDENTYLKLELEKYKTTICSTVEDGTDYKKEYQKLQEQLGEAIKTIKYLSSLL